MLQASANNITRLSLDSFIRQQRAWGRNGFSGMKPEVFDESRPMDGWHGSKDLDHALEMFSQGYPPGQRLVREATPHTRQKLGALVGTLARVSKRRRCLAGGVLNIPEAIRDTPETFTRKITTQGLGQGSFVNGYINIGYRDGTDLRQLANNTAILCAAIQQAEILNLLQFRLSIIVAIGGVRGDDIAIIVIRLKDFSEPLSPRLAGLILAPFILRRFCFNLIDNHPTLRKLGGGDGCSGGYGYAISDNDRITAKLKPLDRLPSILWNMENTTSEKITDSILEHLRVKKNL